MPESRFVSAERLRSLIGYLAAAFVALLAADWVVQAMGGGREVRQFLAIAWIVGFPLGGVWIWRRT